MLRIFQQRMKRMSMKVKKIIIIWYQQAINSTLYFTPWISKWCFWAAERNWWYSSHTRADETAGKWRRRHCTGISLDGTALAEWCCTIQDRWKSEYVVLLRCCMQHNCMNVLRSNIIWPPKALHAYGMRMWQLKCIQCHVKYVQDEFNRNNYDFRS